MEKRKIVVVNVFLLLVFFFCSEIFASFQYPYGVNAWQYPTSAVNAWKDARIMRFRIMQDWGQIEPNDIVPPETYGYNWDYAGLNMALQNATTSQAKLSLCVYGSPDWARSDPNNVFSYNPAKYAEFVIELLKHCDSIAPGSVESVEIDNEHATGWWIDGQPLSRTDVRDPSQGYANVLKTAYTAIKAYNPNIIVVMTGIWAGAYHLLDDLYQLGCKGYFDRINNHYYTHGMGSAEDPSYTGTVWHYPTVISYLKYIAEQNNDPAPYLWLTEFGWRISNEVNKSNYMKYVLDNSRKSGFVDTTHMYVGLAGGYPDNYDLSGLIYTDHDWAPSFLELTTSYWMYYNTAKQYPVWDPANREPINPLPGGSSDVNIINPGFENGNTNGWTGATLETTYKHSGNYSGRMTGSTIRTNSYTVEANRLYEIIAWVKIDASAPTACRLTFPQGNELNYWGVVDTRNYPGGWRRIRYMRLTTSTSLSVEFSLSGTGTLYVDDVQIKALNLSNLTVVTKSNPPSKPTNLMCNGMVSPKSVTDLTPDLSWTFVDPDAGDTQSAYQVILSTSQSDINNNIGSLFDTKRFFSVATKITYNGPALQLGTTYYWKVRTWDYICSTGAWSDTATFTVATNQAPDKPTNLLCNNMTNPTDLKDLSPEFSWKFNDPNIEFDYQSAYKLIVADNLTDISSNTGNILDTGKVISSTSQVKYIGQLLQPRTTYYWKVTTWDRFDIQGPYSDTANFVMSDDLPQGYALLYNGDTAHVNLSNNNLLNITSQTAQGLTVEMWIYRLETGVDGGLFGRYAWDTGGYEIWIDAANILYFQIASPGYQRVSTLGYQITPYEWHHIACQVSGTQGAIYVDGINRTSGSGTVSMPASITTNALVGGAPNGSFSKVIIDELRISNIARYTSNFTLPQNPYTPDVNTVGLWHFDEAQGTTTADSSGNNITGTLVNGPVWVEGYFVTGGLSLTVTYPNGGEIWNVGSQQTVLWTSQGNVGNLNIDLSTDGGNNWTNLVSNTPNDSSQIITVPDMLSTLCRIRISETDGTPFDISNANFTINRQTYTPVLWISTGILNFSEVKIGQNKTMGLEIRNTGGGLLTGTVSSDKDWISVYPEIFSSNEIVINVTVDNETLNEKQGEYTGTITIQSTGGNAEVLVSLTATCILVKPNPYNPVEGSAVFYGNGIVPDNTIIKIWSLNGELIKVLRSERNNSNITWDGRNEVGNSVLNGIYIYTYETSKEKGAGKFTLLR